MLLDLTLVESITMTDLVQQLANELAVRPNQVTAAIALIDEGASVPFIARYRKEVTQGLDDTQLRQLDTRLTYLRDLFDRREKVLESLKEQRENLLLQITLKKLQEKRLGILIGKKYLEQNILIWRDEH